MTDSDTIFIHELKVSTQIGIFAWEQAIQQTLLFDLELNCDICAAGKSGQIQDAIDYAVVAEAVTSFVSSQSFQLIEQVAEQVANLILAQFSATKLRLTVTKIGAIANAKAVGVSIERSK